MTSVLLAHPTVPLRPSYSKQEGNGPLDERATMAIILEVIFGLRFEISNLNYPGIHVHVASNSHFGGL